MANPQRGEVEIEVNGRAYTLALDLNALADLQFLLRPTDPESLEMDYVFERLSKQNPIVTRAFVWALLRRHHPELTLAQVSDLVVDAGGAAHFFATTLGTKLQVLAQIAQPDARDRGVVKEAAGNGRPPRAAPDGTGSGSTSRRAKSGSVPTTSGA